MTAGLRESAEEAKKLGLVMDDEVRKSIDDLGDALDRFGKRSMVTFAPLLKGLADLGSHAMTGAQMWQRGFGGGGEALDQKFGSGFRSPLRLLTGDFWKTFLGGMNQGANQARDAAEGTGGPGSHRMDVDPEKLFADQQRLQQMATERVRMEQELAQKQRQLTLNGLSGPALVAALESERRGVLGQGLEKPDLKQQLKLTDLDLQLQAARRHGQGAAPMGDSLGRIGVFTGVGAEAAVAGELRHHTAILQQVYTALTARGIIVRDAR
jgi:hypothetical protein